VFYRTRKHLPTVREAAKLFGLASLKHTQTILGRLRDDGFLGKGAGGKLTLGERFYGIPLLGVVEAGFPSPAEEELLDTVSFDEYLGAGKEARFILKVKGDSMIEAGIQEGDMVIVERNTTPKDGDIVIANMDGEWTMKYFRKKGNKHWLEAANTAYEPMHPDESLEVAAVVKHVIRSY
jgi:repressor LexA